LQEFLSFQILYSKEYIFHYLCVPKRKFFQRPLNSPTGEEGGDENRSRKALAVDRIWEIK